MTSPKSNELADRVAVVTGAASGIGRATALAFARQGARVVVADLQSELGAQTAQLIEAEGGRSFFQRCDVSQAADVRALFKKTSEIYGRLDFAFNNAGIEGTQAPTSDVREQDWDRVLSVNLKSVWLCMKEEIPLMQKTGGGSIVNCSSIAGVIGFPGIAPYVASKHAVLGLTKTAALECAKQNIRVNTICPGVIETPMIDRFTHGDGKAHEQLIAGAPMGRSGRPEEIASAVLWLCSPGASYMTGQSMVIDGGWVAQ